MAKTGAKVSKFEAVSTITLKYEADLDLELAAAEVGLPTEKLRERIDQSDTLRKHFGSLRSAGGTVSRQIWVQAFGDVTRELRLGTLFVATLNGATNQDNTGELDPLESRDGAANQMAFTGDGLRAAIAAADRSVRLWDVEARRDVKRFIGHTASVWAVALSLDGKFAISGSMDGTARVWDVVSGPADFKSTPSTRGSSARSLSTRMASGASRAASTASSPRGRSRMAKNSGASRNSAQSLMFRS